MSKQIEWLISSELIAKDLDDLTAEAMSLVDSEVEAYMHGESPTEGKELSTWLEYVSEHPNVLISKVPILLEAYGRAIASLIAKNNYRLLHLLSLVPDDTE